MKSYSRPFHFIGFLGSLLGGVLALQATVFAQRLELRPNLQPLPASNISLSAGVLFFTTTSWNSGNGPLELIAGQVDSRAKKQKVYQRVYYNDGTYYDHLAGDFVWHKLHNHFHFEQYALYTLQPVDAPGASQRTSQKTTFCVTDSTPIDTNLTGAPSSAVYSTCGNIKQGMSVGWADIYGSFLAGQSINVTGLPDGRYNLIIEVDPQTHLLEVTNSDNVSCVVLDLSISTSSFTVVDDTGCSDTPLPPPPPPPDPITLTAINPSVVQAGSTVNVSITGSGFAQGMNVSFANGSGQTPTVSNIRVVDDHNLTATVTVKKGGNQSDPVWDLRVGTAVLTNGFTVR
jgi:hypothetical protein